MGNGKYVWERSVDNICFLSQCLLVEAIVLTLPPKDICPQHALPGQMLPPKAGKAFTLLDSLLFSPI